MTRPHEDLSFMQSAHRSDQTPFPEVQAGNREWWTRHTMSYDWKESTSTEKYSDAWFQDIDERFIYSARLFATKDMPFDQVIPFNELSGKKVLEIGCGMGLHSELISRAGAMLTAVDLSSTSVAATQQRLRLRGLKATVQQGDAEELPFGDNEFDFVWSWGVIHHSARTAKIVREIARVLKPSGNCRIMVYNREGMSARIAFLTRHLLRLRMLRCSFDETLHNSTDGFSARHYVIDQFEDLFRAFFRDVSCSICGQDSDAVPLPRGLRRVALRLVSEDWLRRKQAERGSFLFLQASSPI